MKTPTELLAEHVDWVKDEWPMVHEEDAIEAMWAFGVACFEVGCREFAHGDLDELIQKFGHRLREKDEEWKEKRTNGLT